ncbi:hypothetical protein [Streptomyces sp. NPDC088847]|uniref:hypothetical protein n=1 Tax=Streptomyces sp. NPDC088847 TaxID=3365909 RepID=UPI003827587C
MSSTTGTEAPAWTHAEVAAVAEALSLVFGPCTFDAPTLERAAVAALTALTEDHDG